MVLDLMRFGAALLVLVGHLAGGWLTGGYLWQLGVGLHAAVMVFFVLSGYVIAATTTSKATVGDYATARLSRLYSVVLPALAITWACDALGSALAPDFYRVTAEAATGGSIDVTNDLAARYAAAALFVNGFWTLSVANAPGSNGPFWSMAYEAAYYVIFGLLMFARGWVRWIGIVSLLAFAGPRVLVLWPLWMLGVWLWRIRGRVPTSLGWPLLLAAAAAAAAFVAFSEERHAHDAALAGLFGQRLLSDYWAALTTAAAVLGASLVSPSVRGINASRARTVRSIADHTFELYLIHIPVAYVAVALSPLRVGTPLHAFYVYGVVALAVFATARITGRLKTAMRAGIGSLWTSRGPAKTA